MFIAAYSITSEGCKFFPWRFVAPDKIYFCARNDSSPDRRRDVAFSHPFETQRNLEVYVLFLHRVIQLKWTWIVCCSVVLLHSFWKSRWAGFSILLIFKKYQIYNLYMLYISIKYTTCWAKSQPLFFSTLLRGMYQQLSNWLKFITSSHSHSSFATKVIRNLRIEFLYNFLVVFLQQILHS